MRLIFTSAIIMLVGGGLLILGLLYQKLSMNDSITTSKCKELRLDFPAKVVDIDSEGEVILLLTEAISGQQEVYQLDACTGQTISHLILSVKTQTRSLDEPKFFKKRN